MRPLSAAPSTHAVVYVPAKPLDLSSATFSPHASSLWRASPLCVRMQTSTPPQVSTSLVGEEVRMASTPVHYFPQPVQPARPHPQPNLIMSLWWMVVFSKQITHRPTDLPPPPHPLPVFRVDSSRQLPELPELPRFAQ